MNKEDESILNWSAIILSATFVFMAVYDYYFN